MGNELLSSGNELASGKERPTISGGNDFSSGGNKLVMVGMS